MEQIPQDLPIDPPLDGILLSTDDSLHAEKPHERIKKNAEENGGKLDFGLPQFFHFEAIVEEEVIEFVKVNQINVGSLPRLTRVVGWTDPPSKESREKEPNPGEYVQDVRGTDHDHPPVLKHARKLPDQLGLMFDVLDDLN